MGCADDVTYTKAYFSTDGVAEIDDDLGKLTYWLNEQHLNLRKSG